MTPERKVWIVVLCIIVVGSGITIIEFKKAGDKDYKRSLNETPYLITEYENGVYLIKINPAQYRYETEELLTQGLAEMKGRCTIISFEPLVSERAFGIIVTTSGACEIVTTPYKRLR